MHTIAQAVDTETTMNFDGTFSAHPAYPGNKVLTVQGLDIRNDGKMGEYFTFNLHPGTTIPLVMHNSTFDIPWIANSIKCPVREAFNNVTVFDTASIEYMLGGQKHTYPGLDETCKRYGIEGKSGTVAALLDKYGNMESVPKGVLNEYCRDDVKATGQLFVAQTEYMKTDPSLWKLAVLDGQASIVLSEMVQNGMKVDKAKLDALYVEQQVIKEETVSLFRGLAEGRFAAHKEDPEEWQLTLDVSSNQFVSLLLFGGMAKKKVVKTVGTFKNGNPKTKKELVDTDVSSWSLCLKGEDYGSTIGTNGLYSVSEEVITHVWTAEKLKTGGLTSYITVICETVLKNRRANKLLGTFIQGVLSNMINSKVHPLYNTTSTVTGRLSSAAPNGQNQDDLIKACITSRFDRGNLIELDFSQLEIVVLAWLSGDLQLIDDINTGVDIHNALFEDMYKRKMKPEERRDFKRRSFQLIYGAGPSAIAASCGCTLKEAKDFINTFYKRYPGVKSWQDSVMTYLKTNALPSGKVESGYDKKYCVWRSPITHRRYYFEEEWTGWSKSFSFSPTKAKNYPVQGTATGDFAKYALWHIARKLWNSKYKNDLLMIGTVHDSVLFDMNPQNLGFEEAVNFLKEVMSTVTEGFEMYFDTAVPCRVKCKFKIGTDWLNMEEI